MSEELYQTELFGPVRIVGRDMTGRVLIETTERRTNRPEWPQTTEPGWREWVSQFAVGPAISSNNRGSN